MTGRDLVYSALEHRDCPRTPQAINLTVDGYEAYGQRLLEDYRNDQVLSDLKAGRISFHQAGNYLHEYAFSRTVFAADYKAVALCNFEADIIQGFFSSG